MHRDTQRTLIDAVKSQANSDALSLRASICACAAIALLTGCVTPQSQQSPEAVQAAGVATRLQESERLNGRLTVRIEELEDQIFLLQDRVEANRLSLQRKGYMRGAVAQGIAQAAPAPAAESHYNSQGYGQQDMYAPRPSTERRDVVRIPLGGHDDYRDPYENYGNPAPQAQARQYAQQVPTSTLAGGEAEIVITDKDVAAYGGGEARTSKPTGQRKAQAPVTSEKLATSDTLKSKSASELERPTTSEKKAADRDSLTIYKDSLADYRAGNYAQALTGFQEFLSKGPREDYVDNALYWIGECQFGLGEFGSSVAFFQRVLQEQPDGNKVPDSMLKMSLAYERLGQPKDAKIALESLIAQYPTSMAGKLGQKRLGELK